MLSSFQIYFILFGKFYVYSHSEKAKENSGTKLEGWIIDNEYFQVKTKDMLVQQSNK